MTRPSIRVRRASALALATALALTLLGSAHAQAPPDFSMPQAETSPGPVVFSHTRHMPRVEKCSRCHMRDFKMQRGASPPVTLAAKEEGKLCGACHDGKTRMGGVTVFAIEQCDRCHKP
jgi:c(7)-type cytochrome triheme protein